MDAAANEQTFANREEGAPVIRVPAREDDLSTSEGERGQSKRDRVKDEANKVKESLSKSGLSETKQSLQDRFFNGILAQVLPTADVSLSGDESAGKKDRRSRKYVERPNFSIPLMSSNFRRFNARVGVVFVLQNRLIHLFTWERPAATLSFLAVYTLVCLNPHLLPVIPLIGLLFWIMIPSFLARHPAPANDPRVEPDYRGPPIAPPSRVKPVPEMSKDFFRNMRDLQNCMEDFSRVHDAANEVVTPYTNFSDEGLSSTIFVFLFALNCVALIGSKVVPWRPIMLLAGWAMVAAGHPEAQKVMLSTRNLRQAKKRLSTAQVWLRSWVEQDIVLDAPPERREVEIFELQKYHPYSDTWEAWLFSASPYDPMSPARIAGRRSKGAQFFEDVQVPAGWVWRDKKWTLDLYSREWVEQRMITGVDIEIEGERWVYDVPQEEIDVAGTPTKSKKAVKAKAKSGWEEGEGFEERGKWRRRRWVRVVERKVIRARASTVS